MSRCPSRRRYWPTPSNPVGPLRWCELDTGHDGKHRYRSFAWTDKQATTDHPITRDYFAREATLPDTITLTTPTQTLDGRHVPAGTYPATWQPTEYGYRITLGKGTPENAPQ